jgi:phosphatidylinositol glycan class Q protein
LNVLRGGRIDSCDYDVDQLLLGTLLFALVSFLFPTILVYYVFFSLVRFLVTLVHAALFTTVLTVNSFPFFALVVRLIDRGRLPGAVWFEVRLAK